MEAMDYNNITLKIKNQATVLGACPLIEGTKSLPNLLQLLFTPQGVEFATAKRFPTAALWREIKPHMPKEVIKVDAGNILLENPGRVVLAGDTRAEIRVATPNQRCEVLVFEGATAEIHVTGYGVVFWGDCGAKEIKITTEHNGLAYEL